MKKILPLILIGSILPSYATVSEIFEGADTNYVKAGIAKYILTKGGKIDHGESYSENTFRAFEQIVTKKGVYNYYYGFRVLPVENGTRLDMNVMRTISGSSPYSLSTEEEKIQMEKIANSIKGRYLYGLGFDFEYYDTPNGKIKAPKGRENGIKLTAVKYDAYKKGLMVGDVIIEINNTPLNEIPIREFSTILFAHSMTDSITLKYKRGNETGTVTLIPRLSNSKVF